MTRLAWGQDGPASNSVEAQGGPSEEFWRHLAVLHRLRFGDPVEDWSPEKAFEYFGFKVDVSRVNDSDSYGYGFPNYATIETDYDGMGGRPEWVKLDRVQVGHLLVETEAALRQAVACVRGLNASGDIMQDLEKQHLLVTIEAVRKELTDAPYANKSALRGLGAWLGKIAVRAGEAYLGAAAHDALSVAGQRIQALLGHLAVGSFKLPW